MLGAALDGLGVATSSTTKLRRTSSADGWCAYLRTGRRRSRASTCTTHPGGRCAPRWRLFWTPCARDVDGYRCTLRNSIPSSSLRGEARPAVPLGSGSYNATGAAAAATRGVGTSPARSCCQDRPRADGPLRSRALSAPSVLTGSTLADRRIARKTSLFARSPASFQALDVSRVGSRPRAGAQGSHEGCFRTSQLSRINLKCPFRIDKYSLLLVL